MKNFNTDSGRTARRAVALLGVLSFLAVIPAHGAAPVLTPVDSTPSNGRTAVILIHGIWSSDPWANFVDTVAVNPQLSQRIKLFKFRYDTIPGNLGLNDPHTIAEVGTALGDALYTGFQNGTFDGGQVILIAHSLGGLVARSMMKYYTTGTTTGNSMVSLLITLGTPHHGTPLANNPGWLANLANTFAPLAGGFVDDMRWDGFNANEFFFCNPSLRELNLFLDNGQFPFISGLFCPLIGDPPPDLEDGKLVAYGGVTDSPTNVVLQAGQALLGQNGQSGNDGAVPLDSATFSSWHIQHFYLASPCDHFQLPEMACPVGRGGQQILLFDSVKQDILSVLPAPVIASVSPPQFPASASSQLLTLRGSGFSAASRLRFFDGTNSYPGRVPTFVSRTQLTYAIHVGTVAGDWTVVVDDGSKSSNAVSFVATTPVITTAPASPIGLTATPVGWSRAILFYADWTNPADPSGIARVWWKTDSPPRFSTDGVPLALPLFKPLPLGFLGDSIKTFYIWLENGAGLSDFTTARSVTVMRDLTPPAVQITSPTTGPTLTWTGATLPLAGTASDNLSGVQSVVWQNDKGGSGAASLGSGSWSASIPLAPGDNLVTVTAMDATGNATAVTLTVTRPPTLGSIQVNILPGAAVAAGAQWKLASDSSWHPSGTAVSALPLGTYQVLYQPIPGWVAPASQSVAISPAGPTAVLNSAPYVQVLLSVSPTQLSFLQQGAQLPAPQTLQITDRTGGSIHWSAVSDQSWLQLSASGGSGNAQVAVSVNPAGLDLGLHQATLTVSDQAGVQPAQVVPVVLTLLSSGKIDFSWTRVTDMPQPRLSASIASLADGIHLIGGSSLLAHDLYNPATNGWSPRAQPPGFLAEGGAVAIGSKIYAEDETLSPIMIYDDPSDTWTTGAAPSMAHRGPAVAAAGGSMLLISGVDSNNVATATVESYDPAANRWTLRAPIPTARAYAACVVLNGLVHVMGGRSLSGPDIRNTLEIYDPVQDRWTTGTPMPTRRSSVAAAVLGGRIYVFGGFDGSNWLATVEEYNPVTRGWRTLSPLTSPRYAAAATSVGNSVYLFGGGGNSGYLALAERGDPFGLPNQPPVAVPDAATMPAGTPSWSIGVLSNDHDPEGDPMIVSGVLPPQHGTAAVDPSNTFVTYTPAPGFLGTDVFQYTNTDGFGGASAATVTVEVRAPLTNLRVTLGPDTAVALGARWRLGTEATWHASGDILYGLSPGDYTIQCSPVMGWRTPAPQALHLDGTVSEVDLTLAPYQGTDFFTVLPCRLLDTRLPTQGPALTAGVLRTLQIAGLCGIPSSAQAISANATVVNASAPGYLSLFAAGTPLPPTTSLSFGAGQVRANSLILGLSGDGTGAVAIFPALALNGTVDVILDVNGYFQ